MWIRAGRSVENMHHGRSLTVQTNGSSSSTISNNAVQVMKYLCTPRSKNQSYLRGEITETTRRCVAPAVERARCRQKKGAGN
jgi:hypothetical protein